LGGAFVFLGKLFIIVAAVLGSYQAIIRIEPYKSEVTNPFLPCIVKYLQFKLKAVLILAYAISTIFM